MIHFALPQKSVADPKYKMYRDTLIRIWWDGEAAPSVDVPFGTSSATDGPRERIDSALVTRSAAGTPTSPCPSQVGERSPCLRGPERPGDSWEHDARYSNVTGGNGRRSAPTTPTSTPSGQAATLTAKGLRRASGTRGQFIAGRDLAHPARPTARWT